MTFSEGSQGPRYKRSFSYDIVKSIQPTGVTLDCDGLLILWLGLHLVVKRAGSAVPLGAHRWLDQEHSKEP